MQKPKGTYDVIENRDIILYIEKLFKTVMENYDYNYIKTPIFESSELFHRSVGETTDIISKETYDFLDKGGRNMTLRPEGTAGVVRAFIENKLYATESLPYKCWYSGPMFRYERPQSGRFREFYQFGTEVFGCDNPVMDAEIISIPVTIYKLLGLKGVKVKINSIGDQESRDNYKKALMDYFRPYIDTLCTDCQTRFLKNPLRILDCKVDSDKEIFKNVPKMTDYLNEESKNFFEEVKEYLNILNIEYEVDNNLVRGLDYYTHTVFEVIADIEEFKGQNVLCGGGRYNNLIENLEGPSMCGVGFALGLERLLNALEAEKIVISKEQLDLYVVSLDEDKEAFSLTMFLRTNGFKVNTDYLSRSLKANFKRIDKLNPKYVIILGNDEVENNYVTFKNNKTKETIKINNDDLIDYLDNLD